MTNERGYRQFDCLDCGKTVREPRGFTGFNISKQDQSQVEIEYYDYCKKCGNRRLKEEKQKNRLMQILATELVSHDFVQKYMKGEIGKKEFWETVNKKELELRKARLQQSYKRPSPSNLKRLEKRRLEREYSSFQGQCKIARGF